MRTSRGLVLTVAAAAIIAGSSITAIALGVATDASGSTTPTTPAQSTSAPIFQPGPADVSLVVKAGQFVVTWDTGGPFTGGCGFVTTTNVTPTFVGGASALVKVGTGGGTLTISCSGNGTGASAQLTATRTTIH
jgi:hypothetical protein